MREEIYEFPWCSKCDCLEVCYFQHGEMDGPKTIVPECTKGPYKNPTNSSSKEKSFLETKK